MQRVRSSFVENKKILFSSMTTQNGIQPEERMTNYRNWLICSCLSTIHQQYISFSVVRKCSDM